MSLRSGFQRGIVTRATSAGVYVQMPDLYGSSEVGPLDFIGPKMRRPSRTTAAGGTSPTDSGGTPAHTHTIATHTHSLAQVDTVADRFATGDRVLVATVGPGDWVILGRIETGANA
jgi:hypothetical protein